MVLWLLLFMMLFRRFPLSLLSVALSASLPEYERGGSVPSSSGLHGLGSRSGDPQMVRRRPAHRSSTPPVDKCQTTF